MSVEIKVPAAGESITEVFIGQWNVAEGEWIDQDASVVELESDKATFQLPAPVAGLVTKILKVEGDTAEIGDVIGHMEVAERPAGAPPASQPESPAVAQSDSAPAAAANDGDGPRVMPAAARMLAENKLDATQVAATGPGGRLLKEDVMRHLDQPAQVSPAPAAPQGARDEKRVRMSPIRQRIAQRLVEAQQTAALLTTFNEIDMTEVIDLRRRHKEPFLER